MSELTDLSLTELIMIQNLDETLEGQKVRIRGFVFSIRDTRSVAFVVLRSQLETVQLIIVKQKNSNNEQFSLDKLTSECFVEVVGTIKTVKIPVFGCTKQNIEVELSSLSILGGVTSELPFSMKDAGATEEERSKNSSICNVAYNLKLDNRFLDLRLPQTQSIVRIMDGVMLFFRDYLRKNDFIEIKTSKLIQSGSEGGSNLFTIDFFGKPAYLAQSPQLYKQMAVIGGLRRVYEIGHVYRAEVSNINRYLSEFVGLDIEMELEGTYINTINFIYSMFVSIFDSLKEQYSKELEIIRKYRNFEDIKYPKEPLIVTHREAVDILKSKGIAIDYSDDFNREQEKILGEHIKNSEGSDLFVIKDYPASQRAFYTYVDEKGNTRSYDFILRGEEILSGAQRINNYEDLKAAIKRKEISVESLSNYLEPFKFGAPPHAGCGIGFERLLKSYFGFDDIRYFSLFPRDPNRIYP